MILKFFITLLSGLSSLFSFLQKEKGIQSFPVTEEKPFVIIIPSYNNEGWVERNLSSVFSQNYSHYRVIYIDDASSDHTLQKAKQWIAFSKQEEKVLLLHNPQNLGSLANKYQAAHLCQNQEILLFLEGDDFLPHENVLKRLNELYANPQTWVVYSNHLNYPSFAQEVGKKLPQRLFKHTLLRKSPPIEPHLFTCYGALFKQLKIEDLFYRGHFYPMASSYALFYPILEMGVNHVAYTDEVLYLKNQSNPLSDEKINKAFREECLAHIRNRPSYPLLTELPQQSPLKEEADLLIFSKDNPLQLYALLESIEGHVTGIGKINILYTSSSPQFESGYLELKLLYPQAHFFKGEKGFKPLLNKILFDTPFTKTPYILLSTDTVILKESLDLSDPIEILEKTQAFGVYFSHHGQLRYSGELDRWEPLPSYTPVSIGSEALAWQFSEGMDDWNNPANLHFTLYKKENLKKIFQKSDYTNLEELALVFEQEAPPDAVGLFYPLPSALSILPTAPLPSLLEKFEAGLKIDLAPLYHAHCLSQEVTGNVSFVNRN